MIARRARFALALASGLAALAPPATADDIALLPGSARLVGARAGQRFLVEARAGGAWVGDRTEGAAFSVDDPAVARVSPDGVVTPVGDGTTTLRASVAGASAEAAITVERAGEARPWRFRDHVLAVLTKAGCNSGACHGAAAGKNGFRLTLRGYGPEIDYDVLSRQAVARRINKSRPAESLLLLKPTGALEHGGGVKFAPGSLEYRVLAEWIAAGMPRPSADDPALVGVEALPRAVTLRPGDAQGLLVRATYADGRVEDVTRWARFSSTDENVARVDESGRLRVEGHGEGAIAVGFGTRVDRVTVTSPYPTGLDPAVFASAPRANGVDEHNLAKLRSLGIPPAPDAGDAAFLRRAYLDATGTLPPAEAVGPFLADPDPEKRAKLVDRLLASEEFVDFWTYQWSDIFLVSSKSLPPPAMWAFYRFLRASVAENLPWDEMARRIVTARGSTLADGAANYFVLHRDTIDLAENASMAFLGLSLTCARCHNHPLEKWTQDEYYAFANLFARVRLKDGESPGEVIVAPAPEGDIRHPRTLGVMPPRPLDGRELDPDDRADRREALADWLASPENLYFARAIVNRVWRNFFGRGLIDPVDDLRATNPPSDEALLDWLVADFVAHEYDVRHLVRTIMTSATYARSSAPPPGPPADPKFLASYPIKRLPAEVLLDAIARVTGVPTPFPGYPAGWQSLQLPDSKVESTFLTAFGRPERLATCSCERSDEPSIAQALHLSNGSTLNDKLRSDSGAVAAAVAEGLPDAEVVDRLFLAALSRRPTDEERAAILPALAVGPDDPAARREAIEDLYWAVLTGKEFLFNH